MPKINFPKGNVWKEFELDTALITPNVIKLELKPCLKKDSTKALLKEIKIKREALERKGSDDVAPEELLSYFDYAVGFAKSLVVGWDLTDEEDKEIPCDEKNKTFFLEDLLWEKIVEGEKDKEEDEEEEGRKKVNWLFVEIIKFCSNIGNFSKN